MFKNLYYELVLELEFSWNELKLNWNSAIQWVQELELELELVLKLLMGLELELELEFKNWNWPQPWIMHKKHKNCTNDV